MFRVRQVDPDRSRVCSGLSPDECWEFPTDHGQTRSQPADWATHWLINYPEILISISISMSVVAVIHVSVGTARMLIKPPPALLFPGGCDLQFQSHIQ